MNMEDTSPEAQQVLIDLYRKMPPGEKFRRVFDAYETGKMLAMAGLRQREKNLAPLGQTAPRRRPFQGSLRSRTR